MRPALRLLVACLLPLALVAVLHAQKPAAPKKEPPAATPPKDAAADINTPRQGTRHVEFDVTEGTWMSLDVSPDGTTIVFDLLGDLYAMPVAGGTATAISRGPAYDHHPRFSPDGTTIVFTSDENGMENLWLADRDGKNRRELTSEKMAAIRSASWTPDGTYLLARKEDASKAGLPPTELWLFHRHGGAGVKVTAADDIDAAAGPVASRDGRYFYFAARKGRFSYTQDLTSGVWQVVRYDRRTGESVNVTSGMGGGARPQVSPDGRTLVFVSRRDADTVLVARDLTSGRERVLVRPLGRDDQEGFAALDVYPGYAFLPDGSAVVAWSGGGIWRVPVAGGAPQRIPFTAHVEQWLAPAVTIQEAMPDGDVAARILRWPSQSPDGKWIAFDAFGRVWLQALENGKPAGAPRRLTPDDSAAPREYAPAFSPDGAWIAYVTWSDRDGGFVWKAPAPGTAAAPPQKLTAASGHYANPSWSPAGDRLAIARGSGLEFRGRQPEDEEFFEICWLPAAGGTPEVVTTVPATYTLRFHPQATWSRDGARLYYRRDVEGLKPREGPKFDLVSIRLDGTDRKTHLRFPAVADVAVSPDEQWVAFASRDNVYVTALPPAQVKEVPEVGTKEGSVPVWRLSDEAGGFVGWADQGRTITWGRANAFHRLPVASAIAFVEKQKAEAAAKKKQEAASAQGAAAKPATKKSDVMKAADKDAAASPEPKVPASESLVVTLTRPRRSPKGSIAFTGARVVTMKGDEILPSADVLVTGNRIAAVGPTGQVTIPPDARRYDVSGTTIVPGLIDSHAHLHYSALETFPETKWEYAANLAYGVTTVYDPSAPSLDVFAQAEMVETGAMLGPRVYSSGDVLYGGQTAPQFAEVNDQDDARRQVRRMKAYGARMIKVYQQPRRDQRLWFAQACREEKMLLTVEGGGELHTDMTTVLDGYTAFEHALPYAVYQDVVQLLAKSETYYTPTLLVAYGGPTAEFYFWQETNPHGDEKLNRFTPHRALDGFGRRHTWISPEEYHFPTVARGAAAVAHAGGRVALGAHGQLQGLGVHWELWAHAGVGGREDAPALTPHQAWRVATIEAARKIGFSADLGSIEAGKRADFLVLAADPLADIRHSTAITWVVKNGEVFDAKTLRQEWPNQSELPPFFWQEKTEQRSEIRD